MPIIYQMRKFRKKKERKREIARKKKEEGAAKTQVLQDQMDSKEGVLRCKHT